MLLEIKNFQSIKHVKLDMNGFVALTGNSDIGKSAIVRSVKFVLDNEYNKTYLRHGTKKMEITVDGIHRVKSTTVNTYEIAGKTYSKVGMGVPDAMADRGYSPFSYNGGFDNTLVVPQYKPLFLVDETEYVQTKIFQSLFGTDLYEEAIRLINKDTLAINREIAYDEGRKSNLNLEVTLISNKLKKLQAMQGLIHNIHNLKEYKEFSEAHDEITSILEDKTKTQKHTSGIITTLNTLYNFNIFKDERRHYTSSICKRLNKKRTQESISKILNTCSYVQKLTEAKEIQEEIARNTTKFGKLTNKALIFSKFITKLDKVIIVLDNKDKLEIIKRETVSNTNILQNNSAKLVTANKLSKIYKTVYLMMGYALVYNVINLRNTSLRVKMDERDELKNNNMDECPCCGNLIGANHA